MVEHASASPHEEVVEALREIGNLRYGAAVAADRRSKLEYLGVGVPELRARVKQGFSFYELAPDEVLNIWDDLWRTSPYGDVLFAVVEYYRLYPKRRPPRLWDTAAAWTGRVDNWSHADAVSGLYSFLLEADVAAVYPQLMVWNVSGKEWLRRISLVSLIHYTGKNAVFLPADRMFPLVTACLDDHRHYVQTAVGWVLREMGHRYPVEVAAYLEANALCMSAAALSRATERLPASERTRLRALRKGR